MKESAVLVYTPPVPHCGLWERELESFRVVLDSAGCNVDWRARSLFLTPSNKNAPTVDISIFNFLFFQLH